VNCTSNRNNMKMHTIW